MKKLTYKIDFQGLKQFLQNLEYEDFKERENSRLVGAITTHASLKTLETTPKEQIIQIGEPYICDCLGGDLSVLISTNKKYRLPDRRAIKSKFVITLIEDTNEIYGSCVNGLWKIPSQFIKKIF